MGEVTGRIADAPLCLNCGFQDVPAGSCYVCEGSSSGSGRTPAISPIAADVLSWLSPSQTTAAGK